MLQLIILLCLLGALTTVHLSSQIEIARNRWKKGYKHFDEYTSLIVIIFTAGLVLWTVGNIYYLVSMF